MPSCYYTTDVTNSTATSSIVWDVWTTATTTATNSTYTVWSVWTNDGTSVTGEPPRHHIDVQRSAQEIEAERVRREAEYAKRREQMRLAEEKAEALLLANLNEAQRESYKLHKMFEVIGLSGQAYRIRKGRVANVDVIDKDRVTHRLCAHPADYVPDQDTMLAQLLMLRFAEAEFVRTANRHPAH